MKYAQWPIALSLSLMLPSQAMADPEDLHATTPPPVHAISDGKPIDPLPRELHQPTVLEHAQRRKVIGRSLTFAGLGALVVALGVGVPLVAASNHPFGEDMQYSGIALASVFGALGGSALTVGSILWQMGASEETRLRHGDFELRGSVRNRRLAGGLLIGVGVVGELLAIIGGGLFVASTSIDDESGQATHDSRGNIGIGLIVGGSAVAVLGCTIGGTLLTTAGRDQKLSLSLAPGGVRMTF